MTSPSVLLLFHLLLFLLLHLHLLPQCDLMDGRDAFLTMARDRHYEFSSLRRCKYSTLALLYELHTQVMVSDPSPVI